MTVQTILIGTEEQHAAYVRALGQQASDTSTQHSVQLQALRAQHSAELSQLATQHHTDANNLQQQLNDCQTLLREQQTCHLALQQEDHKLMMSQLATFLAWESDDLALQLCTSHDAAWSSLHTQHEQQLEAVQAKMLEQNVDALQGICASSDAAAEGLIACNVELTQGLSQLHGTQIEVLSITFRCDLEGVRQNHAQVLAEAQAGYHARMEEANANHEVALNEAMFSVTQDSQLAVESQLTEADARHAAELEALQARHTEHLAEISTQHEQDQAESLSHLSQALEQLSEEHALSVDMVETMWADKQADQHELHQQQLLDMCMQHDSAMTDLTMSFNRQLEAAEAQREEQLSEMSREQEVVRTGLRQDAESDCQQHSVQLVNLQLQAEQTEHKLRAELSSDKAAAAAAIQRYQELQTQLEVTSLRQHPVVTQFFVSFLVSVSNNTGPFLQCWSFLLYLSSTAELVYSWQQHW